MVLPFTIENADMQAHAGSSLFEHIGAHIFIDKYRSSRTRILPHPTLLPLPPLRLTMSTPAASPAADSTSFNPYVQDTEKLEYQSRGRQYPQGRPTQRFGPKFYWLASNSLGFKDQQSLLLGELSIRYAGRRFGLFFVYESAFVLGGALVGYSLAFAPSLRPSKMKQTSTPGR